MTPTVTEQTPWIALVIGNTRLHWGYFEQSRLSAVWHTPHLTQPVIHQLRQTPMRPSIWQAIAEGSNVSDISDQTESLSSSKAVTSHLELWIASAVPAQSALWLTSDAVDRQQDRQKGSSHISTYQVERSHLPLTNIYNTLGIDRAINLLGAGRVTGWPVVVIDGGTALTFTAGTHDEEDQPRFYGGAILPGLRLQRESLAQKTAALEPHIPERENAESALPARWATETKGAIASGLTYSMTATLTDYLNDWWAQFPKGKAILTGGDATFLHQCLQQRTPEIASRVLINQDLMFYGLQTYRTCYRTC
ncbi:MAG: pantothenate kinase [Cyanobacteria bacterium J06629_19]